jgi:tetrapyrrole methylase family protein/MazG family protein
VDQVIIQIYDPMVGSNVKLALMEHFDDDYEVIVVRGAGIPNEEKILKVPLYDLDRCEALDHLASVYVPCIDKNTPHKFAFSELVDIMSRLRDIDGCPWDQEQTHESLKSSLLEEAYEVIDAIEENDLYALEEELGDVLLQVVFHSAIASENGYFNNKDVISPTSTCVWRCKCSRQRRSARELGAN